MAVQFILGRSGAGKTHFCLEQIRGELLARPDGAPLLFLVPDQATFQMEQALLADGRLAGFHRAHILSFSRLARTILQEVGSPGHPVLSESARQMILARILQEEQENLKIFRSLASRMGFVEQISRMIRELKQYRKTPEDLERQSAELAESSDPGGVVLANQLADLARVYGAYLESISDRFIDPDDFLDLLAGAAPRSGWLGRARLWIDGFAGFTPQQYHALASILGTVREAQISLCLDPADGQFAMAEQNADPAALDPMNLFYPTLQTYQRLYHGLLGEGQRIAPALRLPPDLAENGTLPRYTHPMLGDLELRLARRNRTGDVTSKRSAEKRSEEAEGLGDASIPDEGLVVVEAPTRRKEVEAAAQQIVRLCREKQYRYRDIAVIFRDLSDYADLIQAVFSDYEIPFFLDQPRPARHHPLAELIRSAMEILLTGFQNEPIFQALKTNLTAMEDEAIDALENYAVSRGITPSRWLEPADWPAPKPALAADTLAEEEETSAEESSPLFGDIDASRRRAMAPVVHLMRNLYGDAFDLFKPIPAEKIVSSLVGYLEENQAPQRLAQWHEQARQEGDLDTAQTHAEVYARILELLDEIVEIFGGKSLTLESFAEIFNASLASLHLGLIPPSLDQTLVGSIERSRHPPIRAALILGINEGKFPHVGRADSLISDDHRNLLQQRGFELAPVRSRQLLQEHYLMYIAVTRAHEFLWISYPISDERGRELQPSSIVDSLRSLSGDIPFRALPDESRITPETVTRGRQLGRALAREFSGLRYGTGVEPVWAGLYRWAKGQHWGNGLLHDALAGVRYANRASLDEAVVRRMFQGVLHSSISRLEHFAACPFQYFCRHILGIQAREPLQLAPVDVGGFYHDVLHQLYVRMKQEDLTWQSASREILEQFLREISEAILGSSELQDKLRDNPRRQYHMLRARDQLIRFCLHLQQLAQAGRFTQTGAEAEFGPHRAIPALLIPLKPEGQLLLKGRIDRVDTFRPDADTLAFLVMDYKTSPQRFDFARFYHGLSLQLPGYLEVLRSYFHGSVSEVIPAAALYAPIRNEPGPAAIDPDAESLERWLSERRAVLEKPRGIISGGAFSFLQREAMGGQSPWYSLFVDKDGSVYNGKSSDVVDENQMEAILRHTRRLFEQLGSRILRGEIEVRPARLGESTPCSYCEYRSVCRFDFSIDPYHFLEELSKAEVLEKITPG